MTKEEFDSLISEQKEKGMSEEDIVKAFCIMFKDGDLTKEELIACLAGVGYELTGELAEASDEELKEKIVAEGAPADKEEAKEGGEGKPAPSDEAPKAEEEEVKETEKTEEKADGKEEIDEKEEAKKLFGL